MGNHKTVSAHGPAELTVKGHIFYKITMMREYVVPKLPEYINSWDMSSKPLFISYNGEALDSSQVSLILRSTCQKAGVAKPVTTRVLRRLVSTRVCDFCCFAKIFFHMFHILSKMYTCASMHT